MAFKWNPKSEQIFKTCLQPETLTRLSSLQKLTWQCWGGFKEEKQKRQKRLTNSFQTSEIELDPITTTNTQTSNQTLRLQRHATQTRVSQTRPGSVPSEWHGAHTCFHHTWRTHSCRCGLLGLCLWKTVLSWPSVLVVPNRSSGNTYLSPYTLGLVRALRLYLCLNLKVEKYNISA